jgi:hypothetical protein
MNIHKPNRHHRIPNKHMMTINFDTITNNYEVIYVIKTVMKFHLKKVDTSFHRPLPNMVQRFACLTVFNATFNNISVISWRSELLVEKTTDLPQFTDKLYQIYLQYFTSDVKQQLINQ